jgi:PH (Pleckstrin Homology) domain-containing protein
MRSRQDPEVTAWRPAASTVALPVLLLISLIPTTVSTIAPATDAASRSTGVVVRAVVFSAMLLVIVTSTALLLTRTRVTLRPDGVEVLQVFRRRLYRYDDITDARIDRGTNDRTIKLTLRDGPSVTLPAPTRGLRRLSDPTLDNAVQSIRDRAGLGPAPPRPP